MRQIVLFVLFIVALSFVQSTPAFAIWEKNGIFTITQISTNMQRQQGSGYSYNPAVSTDGRYIAFESFSRNLVARDTNKAVDVFVKDTQTGAVTRASINTAGKQGNAPSDSPAISGDGHYVLFKSDATNLVPNDTNKASDVFQRNMQTGEITRVSVSHHNQQANSDSYRPAISNSGRYVTFSSYSTNLVPNDTSKSSDAFVKDLQTGVVTRVSVNVAGKQGNKDSDAGIVSGNGRYVAFESTATNLTAGKTSEESNLYVKDMQTEIVTRVSANTAGKEADGYSCDPAFSGDGRYIVFSSFASNLVAEDTNKNWDIFLRDMETGIVTRVSVSSAGKEGNNGSGSATISADGRYIAFDSKATNFVADDTNKTSDVFIKDMQTGAITRISENVTGKQSNNYSNNPAISQDGHYVAFESYATNLVAGNSNKNMDIFGVRWQKLPDVPN